MRALVETVRLELGGHEGGRAVWSDWDLDGAGMRVVRKQGAQVGQVLGWYAGGPTLLLEGRWAGHRGAGISRPGPAADSQSGARHCDADRRRRRILTVTGSL